MFKLHVEASFIKSKHACRTTEQVHVIVAYINCRGSPENVGATPNLAPRGQQLTANVSPDAAEEGFLLDTLRRG